MVVVAVEASTTILVELPEHNGDAAADTLLLSGNALTFTPAEAALTHLPVAVAFAVMASPAVSESPVNDHAPPVTVVLPNEVVPPLNTSMEVPSPSVLVPLTEVALAQMGEVTVGVAVML